MARESWLVAGVAVLVTAGCSGVPHDGRVVPVGKLAAEGDDGSDSERDIPVRRVPAGPPAGADPATIVAGFVDAQASFDNDHAVARSFLAPDARWDDGTEATVFDQRALGKPVVTGERATLVVTVRRRSTVNTTTGEYRRVVPENVSVRFSLTRVNGEWRLADPPAGVLVGETSLSHAFRRVSLYYPDFTRQHLVPAPLFLPQAIETPLVVTALRALLAGPPAPLAPSVRTAIPQDTKLIDPPQVDGTQVTVNLSREVRRASSETVPLLAAQMVWTLSQPALGFSEVRLLVEGDPLLSSRRTARRSDYPAYSPELSPGDDRVFVLRSGQVHAIDDAGTSRRLRGDTGLVALSVSRSGLQLAAVGAGPRGQRLVLGRLAGGALALTSVVAPSLTTPSWEPEGDAVWTVALGTDGPRVFVVPAEGGAPEQVQANLRDVGAIQSFQLSADGARAVLVAGGSLWQAYVQPRPDGTRLLLGGVRRILPDIRGVTSATWETSTRLAFVGRVGTRTGPYQVDVDGFGLTALSGAGLPAVPVWLAGGRGAPGLALLAEARGRVWRRERSGDWRDLAAGTDPTYAG